MQLVKLDKIRIDCGTQSRCSIDEETINNYAEMMEDGAEFPSATIYHDGNYYYLADGFHRYFANKKIGNKDIKAEVVNGTLTEAILYSKSANGLHGKPFSAEDKRKNVQEMLEHFEFTNWADREIARRCCVSGTFVAKMRKELKISKPNNVKYTRKGKELTMKPKAEKPKKEKQLQTTAVEDNSVLIETLQSELARLSEINEGIQDELDIKYYEATAEEKVRALQTIDELREENRKLKIDLVAVKKSRDQFQNENVSLKKQIESLNRKLKS
jgi:hypothetical protein